MSPWRARWSAAGAADPARGAGHEYKSGLVGHDAPLSQRLRVVQQGELALLVGCVVLVVDQRGRIVAGEAMVGELRLHGIADRLTDGLVETGHREEAETVDLEFAHHFLVRVDRREEFGFGRHVDAVKNPGL